ncbi:MAG TPA: metallopeptidase TldD-related protein [Solirubrobacteraceae bacterium]|nr:metallopeptidase TldD-related protein [Solirubrobacteraceae bacterium]
MAPSRDEIIALAERALRRAGGEAQATAWWERQLSAGAGGAVTTEAVTVEIAVVRDGRVGTVVTTDVDDDGLARAAAGAALLAATGPEASGLPEPAPGRPHDGYSLPTTDPAEVGERLGEWSSWRAGAAGTAIVSNRGVSTYEERSFGDLRVRRHADGRSLELTAATVDAGELDPAALRAEADSLLGTDPATTGIGPGEYPVVLGAWAVAEVLRRAALAFGGPQSPLAGRLGSQVAAPAVNLSESPRFAATLPRSYDAQGVPRQPLPLIQDGVAHRFVGPDTGHAQAPGGVGGFFPEHLVLVGGGAADISELAAPVELGLFIPALSLHGAWVLGRPGSALAEGVRVIRAGRPAEPAPNLSVLFEPLELLTRVQALTGRQRTIPPPSSGRPAPPRRRLRPPCARRAAYTSRARLR